MIRKLLIANRGEIARRVIRTARRMGIATVAVYSDADAGAAHVRDADEAVRIGPAEAARSYLDVDALLKAARDSAADAVHPGYGFLSENAAFAEAVIAAGLIWVGPPPGAIRSMGQKDEAKSLMQKAGVPVTPGYLGQDQSETRLAKEAAAIGYPVLIKAVAGGGGKGMRRVADAADFALCLAAARREAKAAFGSDRVLLEAYVARPRHIEVQVFADAHGNAVHLFERDCSLQRRHQKIVEEAPAPGMDEATRAAITDAAVRAACAVGYRGAGTVEFIADTSEGLRADRIWFMEMNTRLQVEHPVTEAITGLDLVEWQLRIAAGEKLPLTQDEIRRTGHAVEARLYAEDPAQGFLPSTGTLRQFRLPDNVRVDSGFKQGDTVTRFYDPMLAKLIAHGATREAAIGALAAACRAIEVWPVKTNAGFLVRVLARPEFRSGAVDTHLVEGHLEELTQLPPPAPELWQAAARAELRRRSPDTASTSPWHRLVGFRVNSEPAPPRVTLSHRHEVREIEVAGSGPTDAHIFGATIVLFRDGDVYSFTPSGLAASARGAAGDGTLRAPIPGLVTAVLVQKGARVTAGQPLLTLEAMKMEFPVTAPMDGIVAELDAVQGRQVSEGTLLVRIAPEAG
jgi:acetyl/propionyl-CoA carboxylase alpha subunit